MYWKGWVLNQEPRYLDAYWEGLMVIWKTRQSSELLLLAQYEYATTLRTTTLCLPRSSLKCYLHLGETGQSVDCLLKQFLEKRVSARMNSRRLLVQSLA